jgi:hypothetical protein
MGSSQLVDINATVNLNVPSEIGEHHVKAAMFSGFAVDLNLTAFGSILQALDSWILYRSIK